MAYGKTYSYTLKFDADTSRVRTQMQNLLDNLNQIGAKHSNLTYDDELREAAIAAQQLGRNIQQAFNVDTNKLDLTKFRHSLEQSGKSIKDYATIFDKLGPSGRQAFLQVANAISKAETPALQLNKVLDNLWVTMKNTMRWQLTSSMLHGFIGTVETAWRYTQDLNESLNSIRIVTGISTEEMSKFAQEANKAAQALNTTTVDYTDASLIYYQQGLNAEEVKERTKITIDAANAAGTSAEKMSEYLTAVWNSYQVATDQLESYVDKMAAVGANTATSLEEISTAMVNVASTANTVGVSMDQLTAIISTVASTTRQSANTIGTAYKTIFARMGDLQLGETLEDGLELGDVSNKLQKVGIDILDVNGDLREMGTVVEEIGAKWQTWTTAQQTAVAQAIAGKRQYTQLIALFDNWDAYQNALNISIESSGTLAKQAATFAEGWEAARRNLKAAQEGVYDSLFNGDDIAELDRALAKLFNRIENIVDVMGGFKGVALTAGTTLLNLYGDKVANGLRSVRDLYLQLSGIEKERNNNFRTQTIEAMKSLGMNEQEIGLITEKMNLQKEFEQQRSKLPQLIQEQVASELEILDIMQETYTKTLQENEALQAQTDLYLQRVQAASTGVNPNILSEDTKSAILGLAEEQQMSYKQTLEFLAEEINREKQLNSMTRARVEAKKLLALEEAKTVQQIKEENTQLGALRAALDRVNKVKIIADTEPQKAEDMKVRLEEIVNALQKIQNIDKLTVFDETLNQETGLFIDGLLEDIEQLNEYGLDSFIERIQVAIRQIEEGTNLPPDYFSNLSRELENLQASYQRLGAQSITTSEQQRVLEEQQARIRATIEQQITSVNDLSSRIVAFGQTLFSMSMLLNSVNSLSTSFQEYSKGNITTVDLLTRSITALAMILPIVSKGFKAITTAVAMSTAVTGADTIAQNANTLAKTANWVITKLLKIETISLTAAVAAFVAIAAVAVIGIVGIVKVIDNFIHAEEKAQQKLQESREELEKQKTTVDDLSDSLKTLQDRIEELEAKRKDGSLTLIEEEELERAYEKEASLKRELEWENKIYEAKLRQYRLELQGNGDTATKTAFNGFRGNNYRLRPEGINVSEAKDNAFTEQELAELREKYGDDLNANSGRVSVSKYKGLRYDWTKPMTIDAWWDTLTEEQQAMDQFIDARQILIDKEIAAYSNWLGQEDVIASFNEAEDRYQKMLDMYKRNIINDTEFQEELSRYEKINHNRYSKYDQEQFYEDYVDSVLEKDTTKFEEFKKIYQDIIKTGKFTDEISDQLKERLYNDGITVETFVDRMTDKISQLREDLVDKGTSEEIESFLSDLSVEDLNNLFRIDISSYNNLDKIIERLKELKDTIEEVQVSFSEMRASAKEALASLAEGEFLDDEVVENLKKQFAGIYDFSNLGDLSTYDQARSIGEAMIISSDPRDLYRARLEDSKKALEDLNEEIVKSDENLKQLERGAAEIKQLAVEAFKNPSIGNQKGFDYSKQYQDLKKQIQAAKKELDELGDTKINIEANIDIDEDGLAQLEELTELEIELMVDDAALDAVLAQMGAIEHAASLIGEGFKVEAENVEELIKTMPQLLEDATIDMQTGMIQLQQNIVNQVAQTAENEVAITAEALRQKLTNRYNEIQGEIDLINKVQENAHNAGKKELTSATMFAGLERDEKIKVVRAIIQARMQQAITNTNTADQEASNAISSENQVADAAVQQGQVTSDAWRKTAQNAAQAMYEFAKSAIANQNAIASAAAGNKKAAASTANFAAGNTVGRSAGKSNLSIGHDTIDNPYKELNQYLENNMEITSDMLHTPHGLMLLDENGEPIRGRDVEKQWLASKLSDQASQLGFNIDEMDILAGADAVISKFVESNYDTLDKFLEDVNTAENDLFYDLGAVGTDLSRLLAGINGTDVLRKSGIPEENGSTKKETTPKEEKPKEPKTEEGSKIELKELEEHYHEINKLIEEQEKLLQDVQSQIDRTYGASKLKEYQKEQERLNDLIVAQQEKMRQVQDHITGNTERGIKGYANTLKELGLDAKFDEETGRILNYTDLLLQAQNEFNAAAEEWNSHQNEVIAPDAEGNYAESWQQQNEAFKENAEDMYNKRIEALKQLEENIDLYWEEFEKYENYLRDREDSKLKQIAYVVEFQIDYKDAKKEVRNLGKSIEEVIGTALDHGVKTAKIEFENMQDELNMQKTYEDDLAILTQKMEEAKFNKYIDQEEIKSQLEELRGNIISSAEALIEWAESIESIVPDALDAARERFDQFTNQLEHNTSIIDTIKELMTLQGLTIKTAQGYRDTMDIYNKRMEATLAEAKLNRQWYDGIAKELAIAQSALDNATEGTQEYDILKANRDALLEQFNEAQQAMLDSAKETMETAREMYVDEVHRTAYELEQALTKGTGFDLLQDKYDHYIDTEGRYLDTVNKIYETTKLNNKLQQEIDDSTNATYTKRLKELQDEFLQREKNNKLSEYDIKIMEAKLNMTMKQMELEEVANNRSTLRMVRNSRGNYDYQFTANPDAVNNANQEYLNAAQEWYNLAKDKSKETAGEIINTWQEMTNKIQEVYEDQTLTVDEREAKIAEIREYYTQKVKDLEAEKQKAIADMTEAGNLAINDFRDNHQSALEGMDEDVDNLRDVFSEDLASILENSDDFNNQFAEDMDSLSEQVGRFDQLFDDTINNMNDHVNEFNQNVNSVNDEVGTSYADLKDILDQVADSTEQITLKSDDVVSKMFDQISAAQQAALTYSELADAILRVATGFQTLAHQTTEVQYPNLGDASNVTFDNNDLFNDKTFSHDIDYSAMMSHYLQQEGHSMDDILFQTLANERNEKIDWLKQTGHYTEDYWRWEGQSTIDAFKELTAGGGDQDWYKAAGQYYSEEKYLENLRKLGLIGYATGGYTGDFDNGKLAVLHEKELVLNETDTKNILDAVDLIHGGNSMWSDIAKILDSITTTRLNIMSGKLFAAGVDKEESILQQLVDIQANFPGVSSAVEIEEALRNIINNAAQFASQR